MIERLIIGAVVLAALIFLAVRLGRSKEKGTQMKGAHEIRDKHDKIDNLPDIDDPLSGL